MKINENEERANYPTITSTNTSWGVFSWIGIVVMMIILITGSIILSKYIDKKLSPEEIYQLGRESVYYLETNCSTTITYPNFTFGYYKDENNQDIWFNINDTEDNRSLNTEMTLQGTGFLGKEGIYTNAHVITCSEEEFQGEVAKALTLANIDLMYDDETNETSTKEIINATTQVMKIDAEKIGKELYGEVLKDYPWYNVSELHVIKLVTQFFIEQIVGKGSFNNTKMAGVTKTKSDINHSKEYLTNILEQGTPWPGKDYALLETKEKSGQLAFTSEKTKVGEEVYVIGYPGIAEISEQTKFESTITKGIVSAIKKTEENVTYLQIDAATTHGNSGGPALNAKGKVIGLLTAGSDETQGFNYVLTIKSIKDKKNEQVSFGLSPQEPEKEILKETKIQPRK